MAAEQSERGIGGGAEEIEEKPGGKEGGEEDKREWVGEERNCEDNGDDGYIVDAEVGVVLAEALGCFGERLGLGEGGAIEKLRPGAAGGDAVADGVANLVDESAGGRWGS